MWRMPETFAAAAPICGGGDRNMTDKMTSVPFWIFHGKDDSVVHPNLSARMLKGIQYHGGKAKISMYPGVDHNSWDNAFAEPDFLSWIFSKTKQNRLYICTLKR
jgi:Predicted peptidase